MSHGTVCVTAQTRHFSTARLTRGSVGAYTTRKQQNSVSAQVGLMGSALARVHCDHVRSECSSTLSKHSPHRRRGTFRPHPQNAVSGLGVTPGN